jgi:hypothetical protein
MRRLADESVAAGRYKNAEAAFSSNASAIRARVHVRQGARCCVSSLVTVAWRGERSLLNSRSPLLEVRGRRMGRQPGAADNYSRAARHGSGRIPRPTLAGDRLRASARWLANNLRHGMGKSRPLWCLERVLQERPQPRSAAERLHEEVRAIGTSGPSTSAQRRQRPARLDLPEGGKPSTRRAQGARQLRYTCQLAASVRAALSADQLNQPYKATRGGGGRFTLDPGGDGHGQNLTESDVGYHGSNGGQIINSLTGR